MNETSSVYPAVLTIAGFDPSGGAGIQADLLTFASMGAHGCAAVTAVTVQDTANVKGYISLDPNDVVAQARSVLEDIPVQAIKLGMLSSVGVVEAIAVLLNDYPNLPMVLDPVLRAGGGGSLAEDGVLDAILNLLLPRSTLVTPNGIEARLLAPTADSLEACGHELMSLGADYVLITGGHEATPTLDNLLFHDQQLLERFSQERLPGNYHGSGCTLSAAVTAALAHGLDVLNAVEEALAFTHQAIRFAYRPGLGQMVPDRLFWAREGFDAEEGLQ
ncbi:MAG: bifunctional hydroxymethylpyrimidine kinase/phosphomethylpyrimidine kinase [Pseudomonadota bacterium]